MNRLYNFTVAAGIHIVMIVALSLFFKNVILVDRSKDNLMSIDLSNDNIVSGAADIMQREQSTDDGVSEFFKASCDLTSESKDKERLEIVPDIAVDIGDVNVEAVETQEDISKNTGEAYDSAGDGSPRPRNNNNNSVRELLNIGKSNNNRSRGNGAVQGADESSENAVNIGLEFLAKVQEKDGSWHPVYFAKKYTDKITYIDAGNHNTVVGITALCMMAFTGAGNKPGVGKYGYVVKNASHWLLINQRSDGGFGDEEVYPTFYDHSIAILALADLCLISGDFKHKSRIDKAVKYLIASQNAGGGWDYHQPTSIMSPRQRNRNDLSISAWCIAALYTANKIGIKIDRAVFEKVKSLLNNSRTVRYTGIYSDVAPRASEESQTMTAINLFCRKMLGDNDKNLEYQLNNIKTIPSWSDVGTTESYYYWYYGTLSHFLMKDKCKDKWNIWNKAIKDTLVDNQIKDGARRGSFDPLDSWGFIGGRLYSTAMAILTLETYYRIDPEWLKSDGKYKSLWD